MKENEYPFLVCPYCNGQKFVGWDNILKHMNWHFEAMSVEVKI